MDARKVRMRWLIVDPVAHCNLRCRGCNHFSPYARPNVEPVENLARDLSLLARFAHARELHVSGGEPLLHPEIGDLLQALRLSGVADRVRLVTNGLLLSRAPAALWDETDVVQISLYLEARRRVDLKDATERARRTDTVLEVAHRPFFRETLGDVPYQDGDMTERVFGTCLFKDLCHVVQGGHLYRCAQAAYAHRFLDRAAPAKHHAGEDGLAIEDRPDMADRIRAYLASPNPLHTCSHCLGVVGRVIEHGQLTDSELNEPVPRMCEDMLDHLELATRLRVAKLNKWLRFLPRQMRRRLGLTPTFRPMASEAGAGPISERLWPPQ